MKTVWVLVVVAFPTALFAQEEMNCVGARGALSRIESDLKHLENNIESLEEQIKRLTKERNEAVSAKENKLKEKKMLEAAARQACEACTQLEKRGEMLMKSLDSIAKRLEETSRRVRPTLDGIVDLASRLRQTSDDYRLNECAYLMPGKSDRATLAKCDTMLKNFRQFEARISDYRAVLANLNRSFSELMQKTAGPRKEMQGLITQTEKTCGDSEKVLLLRTFAGQFEEFPKLKVLLEAAEKNLGVAASIRLEERQGVKATPGRAR